MSSRKPLILAAITTTLAFVAVVWVATRPRPGPSRADFDRLRPGMSQAEVENVLHGPPRNDLRHTALVWVPKADGRRASAWYEPTSAAVEILIREDRPKGPRPGLTATASDDYFPSAKPKDGRRDVWISGSGLIAVGYDRDGRVENKYFSTVDEHAPPSIVDWLASRPAAIGKALGR